MPSSWNSAFFNSMARFLTKCGAPLAYQIVRSLMFDRRRSFLFAVALALSMMAPSLLAQEDAPSPAGRGAQGGRGGRGGRGGGGRGNTREFLGLGPAPDEAAAKKGEPL